VLRDRAPVEVGDEAARHDATRAHDRHSLGNREHFLELVRDEDDGDAPSAQPLDDGEEARHFAVRERRGRLVHDDDPRLVDQRATDRCQLLVRDGELADLGVEIEIEPELVDYRARLRPDGARPVEALPTGHLSGEHDVLGDGEIREQGEILVDHLHSAGDRRRRVHTGVRLAVDDDLTGVGPLDSGDDLDEGRLAAPVLSREAVHLAGSELEGYAVEGGDPAESLRDTANREHRPRGIRLDGIHRRPSCRGAPGAHERSAPPEPCLLGL